jgi:hypothetical protein
VNAVADSFECPSCALDVSGNRGDYERCPYCGYEFPRQKTGFKIVAIVLILLMAVFALYLSI